MTKERQNQLILIIEEQVNFCKMFDLPYDVNLKVLTKLEEWELEEIADQLIATVEDSEY